MGTNKRGKKSKGGKRSPDQYGHDPGCNSRILLHEMRKNNLSVRRSNLKEVSYDSVGRHFCELPSVSDRILKQFRQRYQIRGILDADNTDVTTEELLKDRFSHSGEYLQLPGEKQNFLIYKGEKIVLLYRKGAIKAGHGQQRAGAVQWPAGEPLPQGMTAADLTLACLAKRLLNDPRVPALVSGEQIAPDQGEVKQRVQFGLFAPQKMHRQVAMRCVRGFRPTAAFAALDAHLRSIAMRCLLTGLACMHAGCLCT
jgi:hypothetical protein